MQPQLVVLPDSATFATESARWLYQQGEQLAQTLVLVPTSQSIRRVRQRLADLGGGLTPKMLTPGGLLKTAPGASSAVELMAWVEVLEDVPWENLGDAFAGAPTADENGQGLLPVARSLVDARKELQEVGLLLKDGAEKLAETPTEEKRWKILALLEESMEQQLEAWEEVSRSRALANHELVFPPDVQQVVVAGVFDLPVVLQEALGKSELPVTVLVPAQAEESVDKWGRPAKTWLERDYDWPSGAAGSVTLAGSYGHQAAVARGKIAETGRDSTEVAIGLADPDLGPAVVAEFGRGGWEVFDPGVQQADPLRAFLAAWRDYLSDPSLVTVSDLLGFTFCLRLRSDNDQSLFQIHRSLRKLQDAGVNRGPVGLQSRLHYLEGKDEDALESYQKREKEDLQRVTTFLDDLTSWRVRFEKEPFFQAMEGFLAKIDPTDESSLLAWLRSHRKLVEDTRKRPPSLWIDLLLQDLPSRPVPPKADRVLDALGWLELIHEDAPQLVLCGMNENAVPGPVPTNPWLPERSRRTLGLVTKEDRAARDAFLLHLFSKRERLDVVVGKTTPDGSMLQPSRLLLKGSGKELAHRVLTLFKEVKTDPEAAFELGEQWQWQLPSASEVERVRVTALSSYLSCPTRFFLSQNLGMQEPEPDRTEWNARDFGTILHNVLENWGRDEAARELDNAGDLEGYLHLGLERYLAGVMADGLTLGTVLQREAMKLRLSWFAKVQAEERKNGWRVVEVERPFELRLPGVEQVVIRGTIDRIDRHESGALRVLDYKTSKEAKDVVKQHLASKRSTTPTHLEDVPEVVTPDGSRWINLQVPLYVTAMAEPVEEVGYFALGETEGAVKITPWPGFDDSLRESAEKCASWILNQIIDKNYRPAADRVTYDDFKILALKHTLTETLNFGE